MPWSNGVYTRGYASWGNDASANLPISSVKFDLEDNDFAAGLNNCMTLDGLNRATANIPPSADNAFNLGIPSLRWASVYAGTQVFVGSGNAPIWDATNAQVGYVKQTAAEVSASIIPTYPSYPEGNVLRYGADRSGATDSTTAVQAAATVIRVKGGGLMYFPAGTYMINRNIFIGSGTIVRGEGPLNTIIKANPTYIGVNPGSYATLTSPFFMNYNYSVSALTDSDILIEHIGFNWGSVTIVNGGAHSINMRYVSRLKVHNVFSQNGENVTAFLNCQDTWVVWSMGQNCSNAYFDHWDGIGSATVAYCVGRHTPGTNTVQGIQFTGQGSYGDAAAAANFLVIGNRLFSIHDSVNQSSAIICNANGASSTSTRMLSYANYIDTADNGIVYQGQLGRCLSKCDYLRNVTAQPIFLHSDASGNPNNCYVIDPILEDCNHGAGTALISLTGTGNRVKGVHVYSPSGVAYALIATFASGAASCYVNIEDAPNGTGGLRWSDTSGNTTNKIKDLQDFDGQPTSNFPTIASAATIAPTSPITFISGTTQITTITPPAGIKAAGGEIVLVPLGLWTTGTSGNISLATNASVDKPLRMTYQPNSGTWLPGYT